MQASTVDTPTTGHCGTIFVAIELSQKSWLVTLHSPDRDRISRHLMAEYKAKRNPDRCPSHPGAVLDDIMPSLRKPKAEIARLLGISRQHLHEILEEKKPVSPNVAARIGKLIGNGPAIWLRLQAAYDAWHAEREVDVSKIPTLEQA
jgi:addiction module HigA family antidote